MTEERGLIAGRGQANARAALDAAAAAGVDVREVRTVAEGYDVPLKVLDAYEAAQKKSTKKEPEPSTKPAAKKTASRKKE